MIDDDALCCRNITEAFSLCCMLFLSFFLRSSFFVLPSSSSSFVSSSYFFLWVLIDCWWCCLLLCSLVELNDGSFLSCSYDNTAKRWLRTTTTTNNNTSALVLIKDTKKTFGVRWRKTTTLSSLGHSTKRLKVWNTTTCECLDTLQMSSTSVYCLLKTKDKTLVFFVDWVMEQLRWDEWAILVSSPLSIIRVNSIEAVLSICELEDGSFVSGTGKTMKRWDEKEQCFKPSLDTQATINRVIELNRDVIVSASQRHATVKMWKVSTGECLRTLTLHSEQCVWTWKG